MSTGNYTFERINESHYPDLCKISKSAFNIDPGVEYYRNKNKTDQLGETHLGYIAYAENRSPAAFYGVYACLVEHDGQIYKVVQSGDTMTHKNHVGKGLFTTLARMTYELSKNSGAEFVFGSPNYNSLPGFVKKLNWNCPDNLRDYRIKTLTLPLAKIAKKLPFLNSLYKLYSEMIIGSYENGAAYFTSSAKEEENIVIHRNEAFYNYKKLSGSKLIVIDNVTIWVRIDGFLFIGDIDVNHNFNFDRFIRKLRNFSFLIGSSEAIFITSPGTKLDQIFGSRFNSKDGLPVGGADFTGRLPLNKLKILLGDIDTF
jgi:hypothetical protein